MEESIKVTNLSMFLSQAHTCGGLVQTGSSAVRLNHPQYLSILFQSDGA